MSDINHWRHSICATCFRKEAPNRVPVRMIERFRKIETCCFCGKSTDDGIYIRRDPQQLKCGGVHQ